MWVTDMEKQTGKVSRLEFNKRTTIISEGKSYKEKTGLPGETVELSIGKRGRARVEGVVSSPYKKILDCQVQDRCGGCRFRDITYEDEKNIKIMELERLADQISAEFLGLHTPASIHRYRNKMEYTFGDEVKDGPMKLGLHERGKYHNIVEAADCKLVPKDMDAIKLAVKNFAVKSGHPFYHRYGGQGFYRHLVIRHSVADDKYLLNLVTTSQADLDVDGLIEELKSAKLIDKIAGIYHTTNDSPSDAIVADKVDLIYGQGQIYEEILGLRFPVGPFSFFQTNSRAAEELYAYVKTQVHGAHVIWDLFAGSAVIGAIVSDMADQVYSVEINPANVADAREMLDINKITNVQPILADCKDFVKSENKADFIIVDPPRAGLGKKIAETLNESGVERIVYVSCNPVTAVEDIQTMDAYRAVSMKAFDNFRATLNIETVYVLEKIICG